MPKFFAKMGLPAYLTAIVATLLVVPAHASAVGLRYSPCPSGGFAFEDVGDRYVFKQASGPNARVSGDPGMTLSIRRDQSFTASGSISTSSGITVSDVIETVKNDLNVTISRSYTRTASTGGAWTVPSSYIHGGALAIGSRTHSGAVEKWQLSSACTEYRLLGSANYNAPETGWYFKHFKLR